MANNPKITKENASVTLAGRRLQLVFDMDTWERIENEICLVNEIGRIMSEKGRLRAMSNLAALMAHDPEITGDWIFSHMQPADFRPLCDAVNAAVTLGMRMEQGDDPDAVHDVILDELEKKETPEA